MPVLVKIVEHNKRVAIKIESGYRKGNFIDNSAGIQYFSSLKKAFDFCQLTGYTVVQDDPSDEETSLRNETSR